MTNVNRTRVNSDEYKAAINKLARLLKEPGGASAFLEDFLTESETTMVVKRFAAVVMLNENHSSYRVCDTLDMSLSTAQRIEEQLNDGRFDRLLSTMKEKDRNALLVLLEDLIRAKASAKGRAKLMKRMGGF